MTLANKTTTPDGKAETNPEVRLRVLETASELFYRLGVRAVGVDMIVAEAGVAKTSLYRHFRTKDDLIAAFLQREDEDFWRVWDEVAQRHAGDAGGHTGDAEGHAGDAEAELEAHMAWIGERAGRPNYRGCPQINVAAEFPDPAHPARAVARMHKEELRQRLKAIAERLGVKRPEELALQLALVINGAFVSTTLFSAQNAIPTLLAMSRSLVATARI
ncbi:TetR/AcrR family transcriptional regulator [Pararhizobium sp. YC-54]|uniref:TetR/AcrR family transcriptional regulator n=1 Tax=Pararhizobium sp. YC-54 TaxID=2986920 RepID=UPI0021F77E11|nr:TetR/AcrR family transcriptional regulator [Pararhizobium sp. YC-54]MCV9998185.1 TetR/AcrR family transcriptional regulator [Pararhizobium sp. YC-54]